MNGIKYTLTVTIEVLSVDTMRSMLHSVVDHIDNEYHSGSLTADDGDTVTWDITSSKVSF